MIPACLGKNISSFRGKPAISRLKNDMESTTPLPELLLSINLGKVSISNLYLPLDVSKKEIRVLRYVYWIRNPKSIPIIH